MAFLSRKEKKRKILKFFKKLQKNRKKRLTLFFLNGIMFRLSIAESDLTSEKAATLVAKEEKIYNCIAKRKCFIGNNKTSTKGKRYSY